jgi:hypothetical protein
VYSLFSQAQTAARRFYAKQFRGSSSAEAG